MLDERHGIGALGHLVLAEATNDPAQHDREDHQSDRGKSDEPLVVKSLEASDESSVVHVETSDA
jgi:hypothetical protein